MVHTVRSEPSWERKDIIRTSFSGRRDPKCPARQAFRVHDRHIPDEGSSPGKAGIPELLEEIHLSPNLNDEPEPAGHGKWSILIIMLFYHYYRLVNYIKSANRLDHRQRRSG